MLSAKDIGGLMAMMPAFATDNAADIRAANTVDVAKLHKGVDRMIRDGGNVIAAAGSFGEFHTLLPEELNVLAHETVAAAKKRVPVFVGVTSLNSREVVQKMKLVEQSGADGVLVGVPFYFPSTVDNAVRFFREIGEMFPRLNIMIYHNPTLHNIKIPVEAFVEITKNPAVIGMKDSHRDAPEFLKLQKVVKGKMSVFVMQTQYFDYADLGAAGFWSIDAWMGPWPQVALRDAVARGDRELAEAITLDLMPAPGVPVDLSWRETAAKIAVKLSGYVDPGPLRPPFLDIPQAVVDRQKKRVERWHQLCAKYRSDIPAAKAV
ncbi:MAG TPA: dihydrodipicolinate synthase family protein [Xanthobacteraceae bacterium]|nr:dihydrodipicolinate synthase family protein [Xanthobacteraceae bacterium]